MVVTGDLELFVSLCNIILCCCAYDRFLKFIRNSVFLNERKTNSEYSNVPTDYCTIPKCLNYAKEL